LSKEPPRTPKPMALPPGKKLSTFPLSPVDGFVLSRIDGSVSDRDLLALTGLDGAQVQASLAKLEREGLIAFNDGKPPLLPPPPPPEPVQPAAAAAAPATSTAPKPPSRFANAEELKEDVDLELDHRVKILELHARLTELNHYELLGAPRAADKKAVKRAYYEVAALFHPDRFFRKRLGTFKAKMEAIFVRATDAHDTLTDAERRAEYDAYIGEQDVSKAIEAVVLEPPPAPSSPQISVAPVPVQTTGVQISEQARRDALARRLMGGARPPSGTMRAVSMSNAPPASDPEALKRHYENKMAAVKSRLVKDHLDKAAEAAGRADWGLAATNYRAALEASPEDTAIQASLAEVQAKANEVLYASYTKQGAYEEKNGHFTEAARSWQRAARARPDDPHAHERAAFCIVKSDGGNLHEAAQLAQRAIALEPNKAAYHVTLSQVYTAAGLGLNARRELETAARLAPEDATIQALLARGSKG
jgi:curved DNA-binding protein CbpA